MTRCPTGRCRDHAKCGPCVHASLVKHGAVKQ